MDKWSKYYNKITDLKLKNLLKTQLKISDSTYILSAAIFYLGPDTTSEHYTACFKKQVKQMCANGNNVNI